MALLLFVARGLSASTILDFEGFNDGQLITSQYPEITFNNAMIMTSGVSLNEFEFPPRSGLNVVTDSGGSLSIMFSVLISSFRGYFTYAQPLTLAAFDTSSSQVASINSAFSNNEALSGDPRSSANEFLNLSFVGGIARVVITGNPEGGSFALDDAAFIRATTPEPGTWVFVATGFAILVASRRAAK